MVFDMDNDRLLKEAQLLASNFSFFMVGGKLDHLYGYVYESPDGKNKYALEISYDESFPENPPDFQFKQEIPNLSGEIQLVSLDNWTSESHVLDVVKELNIIVKNAVEGRKEEKPQKMMEIPKSIPQQEPKKEQVEQLNKKQIEDNKDIEKNLNEEQIEQNNQTAVPLTESTTDTEQQEEEYITPNLDEYPPESYENLDAYSESGEYPEWKTEDFERTNLEQMKSSTEDSVTQSTKDESENKISEAPTISQTPELPIEEDLLISTEAALIQQEYAMDYIENEIGEVEIYLTITIEQTFIIKINFANYPKKPNVELQEGLKKLIGDINNALDILKNWDEQKPPHVVEIVRELEGKLWFLTDLETEVKMITGEYKTEMIDGIISNLRVSLLTYGFKEFQVELDISKYPSQPDIKYSSELENLIKIPVENLTAYKNWKRKESHAVEILREISWLVDKNSRVNFELALLRGGIKEVNYEASTNKIKTKLAGQMKTKDLSFDFEVTLPEDYPMSSPKIELKSELEGQEDIKDKLSKQVTTFTSSWHPFNYLIDLFNEISKAIFEVSVISCVICHKIECPTCSKKIASTEHDEQCETTCPSCERKYHKHCWDQTILSFGKCGFCLRPPPANLRPHI